MKKILTLAFLLFTIHLSLFTNHASAQWSLTGNAGTTAGTNFIGTTDNKDFVFKTNSIEKGRVKSNGLWQFGATFNLAKIDSGGNLSFAGSAAYKVAGNKYAFQYAANPNYGLFFNSTSLLYEFRTSTALSVFSIGANSGNGIFKGNLKVGAYTLPSTDGTNGQVLKTDGAGILTWSADNNGGGGGSQWTTNGTAIYYNTGNVGIGTSTPGTLFNVTSSTNSNPVSFDGAAGMYISLYEGGAYRGYLGSYSGAANDVDFGTGGTNLTGKLNFTIQAAPKMTIDAAGNVGIGTTAPASLLEVSSSQPDARIGLTNSANFGRLLFAQSGTIFSSVQQIGSTYATTNRQNALEFMNLTASGPISYWTGGSERLRINSSGNVGIGTTAPTSKLHVVGNAVIDGSESITGNLTLSGILNDGLTVSGSPTSYLRMNATGITGTAWSYTNDGYYNFVNCIGGAGGAGIIANFANTTEINQFTVWGNIGASNFNSTSDRKLKTNIQSLDKTISALDVVNELNPVSYDFKTEEYKMLNLPSREQYGFIAQEIQEVLPNLVQSVNYPVAHDANGNAVNEEVLTVNYLGVIPVLTQAIKEQQTTIETKTQELDAQKKINEEQSQQIESLNTKLDAMLNKMNGFENSLSQCCSNNQSTVYSNQSTVDVAKLDQNIPNPFMQNCYIKFYIPSSAKNSSITISDLNGRLIKTFSNLAVGFGTVNINGGELAAGTYQYILVIDGNKVDGKTLVLTK